MLVAEKAGFFLKSKDKAKHGNIDPSTGLQYLKTDSWELKPKRKGPVPKDCNYSLPKETVTHRREVFSIDGESYPSQDIKGKVIKAILPIYY